MRRIIGWFILGMLLTGSVAFAESVYDQALAALAREDYLAAYEQVSALEASPAQAEYTSYVLARYAVARDAMEQAEALWIPLAQTDFLDAQAWLTYTRARLREAEGNLAGAAEGYARVNVCDAALRLDALASHWQQADAGQLSAPVLSVSNQATQGLWLSWAEVIGADGYVLYRGAGTAPEPIAVITGGALSYMDASAEPGVPYSYQLRAASGALLSVSSGVAEATRPVVPVLSALEAQPVGATEAMVSWECTIPGGNYAVYATVAEQLRAVAGTSGTSQSRFCLTGLAPDTAYTVYVQVLETGSYWETSVSLDAAQTYRDGDYRWQKCRMVALKTHSGGTRWSGASRLSPSELTGDIAYGLELKYTWRAQSMRAPEAMLALRTPGGDVYADYPALTLDVQAKGGELVVPIDSLLSQCGAQADWQSGEYELELYLDGQFAGGASFSVT